MTKYWGFFCASCKKFNPINNYEVAQAEIIGADVDLGTSPHRCVHCSFTCVYKSADIAHCTSKDGADPQWPNGVFLKLIYDCPSCGAPEIFSEIVRATKPSEEFVGHLTHMKECRNSACAFSKKPHFDIPVSRVIRVG